MLLSRSQILLQPVDFLLLLGQTLMEGVEVLLHSRVLRVFSLGEVGDLVLLLADLFLQEVDCAPLFLQLLLESHHHLRSIVEVVLEALL